ncbi:MAG TPA: addiction module toxin RelE [Elusimicrobia bacterium]|nr:addiction module toxin RelE [Elusimicrobiota bacterium]
MARPLRIEFDGALYHVTSRGNRRESIFSDDVDRGFLLKILTFCNSLFGSICHAYCLMGNHYHFIMETPKGNLSAVMKRLNAIYSQTYNFRHHKVGALFQGRYKAILIDRDSYLLEACRYIVNNPVKAGLCARPEDWLWSSYGATALLGNAHPCLHIDWILSQFGSELGPAAQKYRKFVAEGSDGKIWDYLTDGIVLGGEDFAAACLTKSKLGVRPQGLTLGSDPILF